MGQASVSTLVLQTWSDVRPYIMTLTGPEGNRMSALCEVDERHRLLQLVQGKKGQNGFRTVRPLDLVESKKRHGSVAHALRHVCGFADQGLLLRGRVEVLGPRGY